MLEARQFSRNFSLHNGFETNEVIMKLFIEYS